MKKFLPWIVVAVFAAWVLSSIAPPKPKNGYNIAEFGRLPVLLNGRIQPFDSVARNTLLSISGKSIVRVKAPKEFTGAKKIMAGLTGMKKASDNEWWVTTNILSATEWLLETMTSSVDSDSRKIFRVQHPDLESMLGTEKAGLEYYSFNDLAKHLDEIEKQAQNIQKAEDGREDAMKNRTPFQKDLMHVYSGLYLYHRLKNTLAPEGASDFSAELKQYQGQLGAGLAAVQASDSKQDFNKDDMERMVWFFKRYQTMSQLAYALAVPPAPGEPNDAWSNVGSSLNNAMRSKEVNPAMTQLAAIATAYAQKQPIEFNKAVAGYKVWLQSNGHYPELTKGSEEFFFNQFEPFYKALVIYVVALLLGCVYWIKMSEPVRRSAFYLVVLAFVIHTIGVVFRMYLEGRPPVTNLYSSAVFVGWGAVLLGMILERIFRNAIGIVAAGFVGFVTLIIAHHLALSGDTMEMLRAVLDTNFWLATHVVCITAGYSAMFLAGLLAVIYILRGVFTRSLTTDEAKSLTRMVYGITCFAALFSFVGTVLGGIWADQSWGRFWGWDPKENGALLIVLCTAITLHARWGGLVRDRGLMILAVFGNIVTSFSWFGVNMLGVGLHSYGFMDAAFKWLMIFIISQVVIIKIGLLPLRYWASFRDLERQTARTAQN